MLKTQTCPVCGKEQIPTDWQQCPQCNADLTCFQVLDALPEPETVRPEGSRKVWWLGAIPTVVLLAGLGWMLYQNLLIMKTLKDNRSSMEYLDRSVQTLIRKAESGKKREPERPLVTSSRQVPAKSSERKADDAKIQEKKPKQPAGRAARLPAQRQRAAVKPEKPRFFWYETTGTDTLWRISERFYQSGRYYPVLLIMNPHLSIYEIKAGQRLKIVKDQKDVIAAFNRSVAREGSCVYLWYQVQGGDTLKTLSRKFYKTDDQRPVIHQGNPNLHLEPGQRIRILLPDL